MKKVLSMLALAGFSFIPLITQAQFASGVISYNPGSGFSPNFTNSSAALGAPASGSGITPFAPPFSTSQIVSIGAGGSLTLQFNTPLLNNPADPYGIDMMIFGNSFFIITSGSGSRAITSGAVFSSTVSTRPGAGPRRSAWFSFGPGFPPTIGTLLPTHRICEPFLAP